MCVHRVSVGRALCVHMCWKSVLCVHMGRSACLVCACVLVGLPCVRVGRSTLPVQVCQSVCPVNAYVSVGLPGVPCVAGFCVTCVSVGLPCVCVHVGR